MRVDRVFDMLELYWYRDRRKKLKKHVKHWKHLTSKKPYKFYAPLHYKEVPGMIVYPIREVMELCKGFGRYTTEDGEIKRARLFTSSFDYLMGMAILELLDGKEHVHGEGKRVELYGWSMGWKLESETEYRYQLPGTAHWIGIALGRGIEVILDKQTDIFKSRMYTYEGASVITRQSLEKFRHGWELELQSASADFHKVQGQLEIAEQLAAQNPDSNECQKNVEKIKHVLNNAWKALVQHETAIHVVDNLVEHVDVKGINLDLQSRLVAMTKEEIHNMISGKDNEVLTEVTDDQYDEMVESHRV